MLALPLDQVSGCQDEQSNDNDGKFHRVIKVWAEATDCPENERHREVATDDHQVESEESPCISHQTTHEIYDDAEDKNLYSREEEIDYDLSNP